MSDREGEKKEVKDKKERYMRKREKGSKVEMQMQRKRQKESEFFLVQKGGLKPQSFIYTVATVMTWTTAACTKTISVF